MGSRFKKLLSAAATESQDIRSSNKRYIVVRARWVDNSEITTVGKFRPRVASGRFLTHAGVASREIRGIMPCSVNLPRLLIASACVLVLNGCSVVQDFQKRQQQRLDDKQTAVLRKEAYAEYAPFREKKGWKTKIYRNDALLKQATDKNVSVQIVLSEQRGLLFVRKAIAMDFPVATGKRTHPTPTGDFTVRGKEKDYHSNLYGKIFDPTGLIVVSDADTRTDIIPEGGKFEGAAMPYWMRLTDTGVGMHAGYVPGHPASHGCIRLQRKEAAKLFDLISVGTPVKITQEPPSLP